MERAAASSSGSGEEIARAVRLLALLGITLRRFAEVDVEEGNGRGRGGAGADGCEQSDSIHSYQLGKISILRFRMIQQSLGSTFYSNLIDAIMQTSTAAYSTAACMQLVMLSSPQLQPRLAAADQLHSYYEATFDTLTTVFAQASTELQREGSGDTQAAWLPLLEGVALALDSMVRVAHCNGDDMHLRALRRNLVQLFINVSSSALQSSLAKLAVADNSNSGSGHNSGHNIGHSNGGIGSTGGSVLGEGASGADFLVAVALGYSLIPIATVYRALCCERGEGEFNSEALHRAGAAGVGVRAAARGTGRGENADDESSISFAHLSARELEDHRQLWYALLVFHVVERAFWVAKPPCLAQFKAIAQYSPPLGLGNDVSTGDMLAVELPRNSILKTVLYATDAVSKKFIDKLAIVCPLGLSRVKIEQRIYCSAVQLLEFTRATASLDVRPILSYLLIHDLDSSKPLRQTIHAISDNAFSRWLEVMSLRFDADNNTASIAAAAARGGAGGGGGGEMEDVDSPTSVFASLAAGPFSTDGNGNGNGSSGGSLPEDCKGAGPTPGNGINAQRAAVQVFEYFLARCKYYYPADCDCSFLCTVHLALLHLCRLLLGLPFILESVESTSSILFDAPPFILFFAS